MKELFNSMIALQNFDGSTACYCQQVILLYVRLFRSTISTYFICVNRNARPHNSLAFEELLEGEYITRMNWLVCCKTCVGCFRKTPPLLLYPLEYTLLSTSEVSETTTTVTNSQHPKQMLI